MIWNYIPVITAFDLLIIAIAIFCVWRCWLIGPGRQAVTSRSGLRSRGLRLIVLGLTLLARLGPLVMSIFGSVSGA